MNSLNLIDKMSFNYFRCDVCDNNRFSLNALLLNKGRHPSRQRREPTDDKPNNYVYICPICNEEFESEDALKIHSYIH